MSKVVTVEYDAAEKVLRLDQPLEGVEDHAKLQATLEEPSDRERPWLKFRGRLSKEDGDELAGLIEEMFPTEK
ncbi:MAG TPA: hypothetical protein VF432_22085 [Thermoanaerobaculia bacterium]